MSAQDRYTQIIESLVNGEEAKASDLLHEAFVDKARQIWSGLVEQDEIVEDEIAEEELEESYFEEDEDLDEYENEVAAEEEYAMEAGEDEEESEFDAEAELASDDEMDMDIDMEPEMGGEEDSSPIEDAMVSVEDALADLKAEFAALMGDEGEEEAGDFADEMPADDFESDIEPEEEVEEELAFESEELDEEFEDLEEAADLKKIGKDNAMHPREMPAGDDGKKSPVGPGTKEFAGKAKPINTKGHMDTKGTKGGLEDPISNDGKMTSGVKHPGEGAGLKPENRGHGAEKRGKKPEKPKGDSMINKAPRK